MNKQEEKLIEKYGREGGWKVPEGYFESVYKEIDAKLPPYPETPRHVKMTAWQRVKPYVYLAAMFAGIWLMMKVFYNASGSVELNLDNPPEHIAMAMAESDFTDVYMMPETMSDLELEREVIKDYNSIEDFERDFGYQIESEYEDLSLTEE